MKKSVLIGLFAIACGSAFAITGTEAVQKYYDVNPAPKFSRTEFKVDTYKGSSLDDSVGLVQYGRDSSGLTETVFEVTKNTSLKGTRFLQSQKKGEDARFIYTPALRQVRRIGVQDSSKSFVGTEFTYNDTSMREIDEDTHELMAENESVSISGTSYTCWKVKSTPVIKKNIEYDYRIQYIDHVSAMPVKIEYFDKNGSNTKTMEIKKLGKITGKTGISHWTRLVTEMTNKKTGRRSVLTITNQVLDEQLKAGYFSQSWLMTGK